MPIRLRLRLLARAASLGALAPMVAGCLAAGSGAAAVRLPPPAYDPPTRGVQTAVLSGGCFWGVQGVFEHVKGVRKVWAGYDGGSTASANYEAVSTGTTGNAESVELEFDPAVISYGEILRIYFSLATDPTQVNQQFPDRGPQYRGEIFYRTPLQKAVAQRYMAQLAAARVFSRPIATRLDPDRNFVRAESWHQDYLVRHPTQPYIAIYDMPKLANLRSLFPGYWRAQPVLAL